MRTAKVLIIEDDKRIREELRHTLQMAGFEVETAADGVRGLELASTPDLVLLNLRLPKMSGLEVLREMRTSGNYTPVIVVSGDAERRKEAEECKIVAFVQKPFAARDLMEKIRRYLRVGSNMDSITGYTQRLKGVMEKHK